MYFALAREKVSRDWADKMVQTGDVRKLEINFLVFQNKDIQLFRETLSQKSAQVHATRPKGSMGTNIELLHMLNTNEIYYINCSGIASGVIANREKWYHTCVDKNGIHTCVISFFTNQLTRSLVRYRVEHSKINFISPRKHVLSNDIINANLDAFFLFRHVETRYVWPL